MGDNWIKVAAVDDVPEDGTVLVHCGDEPVCLYHLGNGRLYATQDLCTHGEASLADGFIWGDQIECPLHQGQFHIPTGKAVATPCTEDLRVYPVKVQDGAVYLVVDDGNGE